VKPVIDDGLKVINTHIATPKDIREKLDGTKEEKES
jgi:hypothetical protein